MDRISKKKGKNIYFFCFFFAFFFFKSVIIAQQNPHITFHHLNITDGLSQTSINAIVQDRKGYMWFATQNGLNRYDGYSFTIFKQGEGNTNSLSHGYIFDMCIDIKGNLWIGTERGLNYLDVVSNTFSHFFFDLKNENSLSSNRIACVMIQSSSPDLVWVGTNSGLDLIDTISGHISHFYHDYANSETIASNTITALYEAPYMPGVVWVGTDKGLSRIDRKKGKITSFRHDRFNPKSLCHDTIQTFYEAPSLPGILWIGTAKGLSRMDMTQESFTSYANDPGNLASLGHNRIRAIFEYSKEPGVLWIGTWGGGLNRFDLKQNRFDRIVYDVKNTGGISDNFVLRIMEDRAGNIWIGTEGGGINLYSRTFKAFSLFRNVPEDPNSLVNNTVRSFCESRFAPTVLWIATNGGLSRFDRRNQQFTSYLNRPADPTALSSNLTRCVYEDSQGNLWVGTNDGGLNLKRPGSNQFVHFMNNPQDPQSLSHNDVRVVFESRSRVLWCGTIGGGLNRFDHQTQKFIRFQSEAGNPHTLSDDRIYSICEDRLENLWVGTGRGLNCFDPKSGNVQRYIHDPEDPASLSGDMVLAIHIDSEGTLWAGTFGGGLSRLDVASGRFTHFNEAQGLANNVVYGILEDAENHLWLSTNHGLSRFSPREGLFKNYDVQDGLQSNEFNHGASYRSPRGKFYFGGINGFNSFYPVEIHDNPQIPSVVLTHFSLFNKPVSVGQMINNRVILHKPLDDMQEIRLSYKENIFSLEFTALNFINPEKNEYAYMLEGLEKRWNYVGNRRFASYTTLPSGKYVFRVKATNNDGVWNETGTAIAIRIFPPFWRTWWFLSLSLLTLGIGVVGFYRKRVSSLEERRLELEKVVAERTIELSQSNQRLSLLNEELAELSIVASGTDNAVFIMDSQGNFEWVNDGFVRRYGTLERMIALRGRNILTASVNPRIHEWVDECLTRKIPVSYETEIKGRMGETIWMQTTLTPILDDERIISKLVGIDADITRVKRAEAEIVKQKEKISEQKGLLENAHKELEKTATHDGLTGIPNHRKFYDFIEQEWRRSQRSSRPISLILADVDFFKAFNETYGYLTGDECLKWIARLLAESIHRPTDLVARYGGEEFVIVLSETDATGASKLAESIRLEVEKRSSQSAITPNGGLTISLGCATIVPKKGMEIDVLVHAADKALFQSKQLGRNRVTVVTL